MTITSSTYTEGPAQIDGRRYVKERHTDTAGNVYEFEWLGSQDASLVLDARAQALNAQLAAQAEAVALVAGTRLPLTKLKFREMFTQPERMGIDALHASFESDARLSAEQKAALRTGLEDYKMAENIALPLDARVQSMLVMYVALGLLTPARMTEILES